MPTIVLKTPDSIAFAQLAARKGALSLEVKGLRFRGGSVYALCKRAYGLKGSKAKVLAQMEQLVQDAIAAREVEVD